MSLQRAQRSSNSSQSLASLLCEKVQCQQISMGLQKATMLPPKFCLMPFCLPLTSCHLFLMIDAYFRSVFDFALMILNLPFPDGMHLGAGMPFPPSAGLTITTLLYRNRF